MTIDSTGHSLVAYSGSKEGLHQDQSDLKLEVSTAVQEQRLSKPLVSVSLPYTDLQGRILQLWKYGAKLIASMVNSCGEVQIISGKKIHNALGSTDTDDVLLARIEKISIRTWQLAYFEESGDLYVWPHLVAAGRNSPLSNIRAAFQSVRDHLANDPDVNPNSTRTYTHAQAATEEKNGRVVAMKDGKPANHVQEVDDFRRCCLNNNLGCQDRIRKLEVALSTKNAEKFGDPEPDRVGKFLNREEANKLIAEYKAVQREGFELLERLRDPSYAFEEVLQQNGLTDSYNATHPKNPVPARGASGGSIGGVGNQVGIIKGLFESLEDMEEHCHYFFMPSTMDTPPFSDEDLRTIIHDVAVGVYIHDSIPFFSLHFNGDSNLYPVIHPVYQNTLVGRVIIVRNK
jgi:hypothetical protein